MNNGRVVQAQILDFDMEDYITIPVEPDDRVYNRAKVKEETRKAIEEYYETDR